MTAFTLKLIACICMLIDHTGAVFPGETPFYFRAIGRAAFPIFAYLVAQGTTHTKDINKYLLRLGIFALVSEVPFDMAFMSYTSDYGFSWGINFFRNTNVFYTLFLGVLCVLLYKKFETRKYISYPFVVLIILAAELLRTDYGMFGVALIFFLYMGNPTNKISRALILFAAVVYEYGMNLISESGNFINDVFVVTSRNINWYAVMNLVGALCAVILICFYNGRQGPKFKWAFYAFYPAHIALLVVVRAI